MRLIKEAETKVIVHRGKQEQEDFEAGYFKTVNDKLKEIRVSNRDQVETILEQEGMIRVLVILDKPSMTKPAQNQHLTEISFTDGI